VLAWGNSIGDYSTNMAMARKGGYHLLDSVLKLCYISSIHFSHNTLCKTGLSNMAMTACFAGPVFNMLIGTGVGFSILLSSDNPDVAKNGRFAVELSPGITAGFCFIIVNCAAIAAFGVFNDNFVPKQYGYASASLYGVYMITSFLLLFKIFG
jgi:sodium/potassium/calcium exchanger 6